jgi:hypothetical protein
MFMPLDAQLLFTHWFKIEQKFYPQILHSCVLSSLWVEPTKCASNVLEPYL